MGVYFTAKLKTNSYIKCVGLMVVFVFENGACLRMYILRVFFY